MPFDDRSSVSGLAYLGTPDTILFALLNDFGVVTDTEAVTLLEGCTGSAHAVPFTAWGVDYVAGTCFETGDYFVDQYPRLAE